MWKYLPDESVESFLNNNKQVVEMKRKEKRKKSFYHLGENLKNYEPCRKNVHFIILEAKFKNNG